MLSHANIFVKKKLIEMQGRAQGLSGRGLKVDGKGSGAESRPLRSLW